MHWRTQVPVPSSRCRQRPESGLPPLSIGLCASMIKSRFSNKSIDDVGLKELTGAGSLPTSTCRAWQTSARQRLYILFLEIPQPVITRPTILGVDCEDRSAHRIMRSTYGRRNVGVKLRIGNALAQSQRKRIMFSYTCGCAAAHYDQPSNHGVHHCFSIPSSSPSSTRRLTRVNRRRRVVPSRIRFHWGSMSASHWHC